MHRRTIQPSLATAAALLFGCLTSLWAPPCAAQLANPGRHARYHVELEPHLVWQWTGDEAARDDGIGLGFRASIPVLDNGPVPTINNNLAVTFGLAWAHFPECRGFDDCDEDDIWVPVTMQWNFFLTQMISVFPEVGLGFRHASFAYDDSCSRRDCRTSSLEVHPIVLFGARFRLTDMIALVLRLGTPSLNFGVSFFF